MTPPARPLRTTNARCEPATVCASNNQGLTLVPNAAQLELTLPLSAQLKLTLTPIQPKLTRECGPKVLKLSCNVSDVSRRASS